MILVVDDEPIRIEPWFEALADEFGDEVELLTDADTFLARCEGTGGSAGEIPRLLVLDVMMPSPARWSKAQTEYGTRTGARIYEWFRALAPDSPVILLTNVYDDGLAPSLGLRPFDRILRKQETNPDALVEAVQAALAAAEGQR